MKVTINTKEPPLLTLGNLTKGDYFVFSDVGDLTIVYQVIGDSPTTARESVIIRRFTTQHDEQLESLVSSREVIRLRMTEAIFEKVDH